MAWRTKHIKTISLPVPLGTLEELCERIKYEVKDRGETFGKVVAKTLPSGYLHREFYFADAFLKETLSDTTEDEAIDVGINNLRPLLPEYEIRSLDSTKSTRQLERNIRIYTKPSDFSREQI